jgi:zinc/manganese transport system substrate-binding protein
VASPRFNPHFIEAKPSDVLRLKRADLFVHGGLDLEAWRAPLVDAAARVEFRPGGGAVLDLSEGVSLVGIPTGVVTRAQGDIHLFGNPHYWLSPSNARVMVDAIAKRLSQVTPQHAQYFLENAGRFKADLSAREGGWISAALHLKDSASLIAYHDEWRYLFDFLGLEALDFIESKPGVPPGPQHLAALESKLKQEGKVSLIVQASYQPDAETAMLAKKTGAKAVILCQSVGELEPCSSYTDMLEFNLRTLLKALL